MGVITIAKDDQNKQRWSNLCHQCEWSNAEVSTFFEAGLFDPHKTYVVNHRFVAQTTCFEEAVKYLAWNAEHVTEPKYHIHILHLY